MTGNYIILRNQKFITKWGKNETTKGRNSPPAPLPPGSGSLEAQRTPAVANRRRQGYGEARSYGLAGGKFLDRIDRI